MVLSDKVSEFKQAVRQVLSGIQTIALPALYNHQFLNEKQHQILKQKKQN